MRRAIETDCPDVTVQAEELARFKAEEAQKAADEERKRKQEAERLHKVCDTLVAVVAAVLAHHYR